MINFTKSPGSDAGDFSETRLMSKVGRVREVVCARSVCSTVRAVEVLYSTVPVLVYLRSNWNRVTEGGGP